jgi:hypothetical protein
VIVVRDLLAGIESTLTTGRKMGTGKVVQRTAEHHGKMDFTDKNPVTGNIDWDLETVVISRGARLATEIDKKVGIGKDRDRKNIKSQNLVVSAGIGADHLIQSAPHLHVVHEQNRIQIAWDAVECICQWTAGCILSIKVIHVRNAV